MQEEVAVFRVERKQSLGNDRDSVLAPGRRLGIVPQKSLQLRDEPVELAVKFGSFASDSGLKVSEGFQSFRQLVLARHRGLADQERHHANAPSQGRSDLDADIVVRVVEPSAALLRAAGVSGVEPVVADHRQENVALVDGAGNALAKIPAEGHVVNVQEDGEVPLESVVQPPCDVGGVITAVGDEKLGHDQRPRPQPYPRPLLYLWGEISACDPTPFLSEAERTCEPALRAATAHRIGAAHQPLSRSLLSWKAFHHPSAGPLER